MKRALAIAVVVCTLGVAGFSEIAIKGIWTATVGLLPSVTLSSNLSLTYTVAGFDITSVTEFGTAGLTSQRFGLKGAFGVRRTLPICTNFSGKYGQVRGTE